MRAERFRRDPLAFRGTAEIRVVESEVLRGNAVGDPSVRELPVYVPPAEAGDGPFPVLFVLAGFTGRGHNYLETHPWREGICVRHDRAIAAGEAPPAILVFPDCFTRFGGSQYVNSSYLGRYEDFVTEELVPLVDEHYPTLPGRRGVLGKSSGGFGALRLAMRHPALFPACASISGDCHFEYGYAGEFLDALRGLEAYEGDPGRFLEEFWAAPDLSGDGHAIVNALAMAACYSPNPESPLGFDLPFDLETGERIEEVWRRWLAFDPVVAVSDHVEELRALELLHLECGLRDEFHLQWGLRILVRRLRELGVPCEHVEHEGGHFGLDHRALELLPRLTTALAAPGPQA